MKMDRMLQFSFVVFASVIVIGTAAMILLSTNKMSETFMLAIETGMRG
jgi:hypothetical protein